MRSHISTLIPRMIRAALRVSPHQRYMVCAVGIDHRSRIISIATNLPYLPPREARGGESAPLDPYLAM